MISDIHQIHKDFDILTKMCSKHLLKKTYSFQNKTEAYFYFLAIDLILLLYILFTYDFNLTLNTKIKKLFNETILRK